MNLFDYGLARCRQGTQAAKIVEHLMWHIFQLGITAWEYETEWVFY